jgi:hypothetical protein
MTPSGFDNRLAAVTPVTARPRPPAHHSWRIGSPAEEAGEGMGGLRMHAQTKGWDPAPGADPLRVALSPDPRVATRRFRGPGLAPARGVLLGSVLGSACWALVATLTWLALPVLGLR